MDAQQENLMEAPAMTDDTHHGHFIAADWLREGLGTVPATMPAPD